MVPRLYNKEMLLLCVRKLHEAPQALIRAIKSQPDFDPDKPSKHWLGCNEAFIGDRLFCTLPSEPGTVGLIRQSVQALLSALISHVRGSSVDPDQDSADPRRLAATINRGLLSALVSLLGSCEAFFGGEQPRDSTPFEDVAVDQSPAASEVKDKTPIDQ